MHLTVRLYSEIRLVLSEYLGMGFGIVAERAIQGFSGLIRLGSMGTNLDTHFRHICPACTNLYRRTALYICTILYICTVLVPGGGVMQLRRRGGTTQTQKRVKLGHGSCC